MLRNVWRGIRDTWKQTGLIYQMLLNYYEARNAGLKETIITEKTVHFGVLNN